ncbi:hypothetical protein FW778_07360 [Ginsengibacter hankyongi]|uniref:Uncharacterized protein n=1 Tax=Ginsengibacter hankyongi TaxID=2607284 RepID=A0A5J5IL38_9BACT|nr:hypothetical protein [Ginsengibacter hankyongi]KAA9041825.1 hypothetical protein FW778_07360 [Ginsengibacter hankyongi]
MKAIFISLCILYGFSSSAQKDYDYQDTRRKNESFARLPKTQIRADLATFTLSGISEAIGKDDLQKIPFTTFGPDFMNFNGDNIKASVKLSPFDKSKHKLDFDERYLIRIDRKTYYGDYGNIPKTYISNITIAVDNDTVAIPPMAYADIYNLNLTYMDKGTLRSRNGIYKSKDGHRIYLYLFCKDATGSYEVTWIVQDKKYLRRVLDYGFM